MGQQCGLGLPAKIGIGLGVPCGVAIIISCILWGFILNSRIKRAARGQATIGRRSSFTPHQPLAELQEQNRQRLNALEEARSRSHSAFESERFFDREWDSARQSSHPIYQDYREQQAKRFEPQRNTQLTVQHDSEINADDTTIFPDESASVVGTAANVKHFQENVRKQVQLELANAQRLQTATDGNIEAMPPDTRVDHAPRETVGLSSAQRNGSQGAPASVIRRVARTLLKWWKKWEAMNWQPPSTTKPAHSSVAAPIQMQNISLQAPRQPFPQTTSPTSTVSGDALPNRAEYRASLDTAYIHGPLRAHMPAHLEQENDRESEIGSQVVEAPSELSVSTPHLPLNRAKSIERPSVPVLNDSCLEQATDTLRPQLPQVPPRSQPIAHTPTRHKRQLSITHPRSLSTIPAAEPPHSLAQRSRALNPARLAHPSPFPGSSSHAPPPTLFSRPSHSVLSDRTTGDEISPTEFDDRETELSLDPSSIGPSSDYARGRSQRERNALRGRDEALRRLEGRESGSGRE